MRHYTAGWAVAKGVSGAGRPGLVNPVRCRGRLPPPSANHIALDWAKPHVERDPDGVQFVRAQPDFDTILAMLASAANTHDHSLVALSGADAALSCTEI